LHSVAVVLGMAAFAVAGLMVELFAVIIHIARHAHVTLMIITTKLCPIHKTQRNFTMEVEHAPLLCR